MKHITKLKLAAVQQYCEIEEKSTEFMIQYMQDTCKVSYDCVIAYLEKEDKGKLFKEINELINLISDIY